MTTMTFEELEAHVEHLTLEEQLTLLERLARSVRERASGVNTAKNREFEAMAADPEIQREIRIINEESGFSIPIEDVKSVKSQ